MEAKKQLRGVVFLSVALLVLGFLPVSGLAQNVDELKNKISEQEGKISQLEEEIAQYENELADIGEQKTSLESEIRRIDITRQKLAADIRLTQENINGAELNIEQLTNEIGDTGQSIGSKTEAVKKSIRRMHEIDQYSFAEMVLASANISSFWNDLAEVQQFQNHLNEEVRQLSNLKVNLEDQRADVEAERERLAELRKQLTDQKAIADANRQEKDQLLAQTENQESKYQELLEEKRAQKAAFEAELRRIESQLEYELDPNKVPGAQSGILLWPLENAANESCYKTANPVKNCITQYFGNTPFAKSGAYNGETHNGVDFRVSKDGTTPVKAALSGTIKSVNHKVATLCQYGKWVLIEHGNGITTLYAHLSRVRPEITAGDTVATGDVIGYAGNTGYSLGHHLHFTVYASEAVSFREYTCNSGVTLTIPVAAYSAYLNPLDYL